MRHRTTQRFRNAFRELPNPIQDRAREAYRRLLENPSHPGLDLKQVHAKRAIYSVRVGLGYRALAVREGDDLIWFWIGSHSDYDRLIRAL